MPSLPTSLILVGLVVAWLVVLVPMVARRREEVPENEDDGGSFRVLDRDGVERKTRRPVLSRTAMARSESGRYDGVLDDADFGGEEDVADSGGEEDVADIGAGNSVGDVTGNSVSDVTGDSVGDVAREPVGDVRGERAVDGNSSNERRRAAGDGGLIVERPANDDAERVVSGAAGRVTGEARAQEDDTRPHGADGAARADRVIPDDGRERGEHSRAANWKDLDRDMSAERSGADPDRHRPVPVRPGRGGFNPEAADASRHYRFRQRRRVALALVILAGLGVGVGELGVGAGWVTTVVAGTLLVLYLAYLRRQVRMEEEIRRRRAARQARARQSRQGVRPSVAAQVWQHRTGEMPSPDDDVASGVRVASHARPTVPTPVYAQGEFVELDDSDPAFHDLDEYQPVIYRRRAS